MISRTLSHTVLALIVFIWIVPFVALVTTSLRSEIASKTSGFWTAFTPTELGHRFSTHDKGENSEIYELNSLKLKFMNFCINNGSYEKFKQ